MQTSLMLRTYRGRTIKFIAFIRLYLFTLPHLTTSLSILMSNADPFNHLSGKQMSEILAF